jgi:hypothetical protein
LRDSSTKTVFTAERTMSRTLNSTIGILCALALAACGGGDSPADPGGNGGDNGGSDRVIKADPSFSADIQEIFARKGCTASGCHGSAQEGGLDLRASAAYAQLVNVAALGEDRIRVIPGDAQNSYLVIKLEGRQSFGSQMPLGGSELDNIDLTNVKNWINQGAKQN